MEASSRKIAYVCAAKTRKYRQIYKKLNGLLHKKNKNNYAKNLFFLSDKNQTSLISEIKLFKPELIVTIGSFPSYELPLEFPDIPIVFFWVYSTIPMMERIRECPNLNGVFLNTSLLPVLRNLKEVKPELNKIGVIYHRLFFDHLAETWSNVANQEGIEWINCPIGEQTEFPDAMQFLIKKQIQAFYLLADPVVSNPLVKKKIMTQSAESNFFVFSDVPETKNLGALLFFSPNMECLYEKGANMILEYLNEEKSVQQIFFPEKITCIWSRKALSDFGMVVSDAFLKRMKAEEACYRYDF